MTGKACSAEPGETQKDFGFCLLRCGRAWSARIKGAGADGFVPNFVTDCTDCTLLKHVCLRLRLVSP